MTPEYLPEQSKFTLDRRFTRRQILNAGILAGVSALGLSLLGCTKFPDVTISPTPLPDDPQKTAIPSSNPNDPKIEDEKKNRAGDILIKTKIFWKDNPESGKAIIILSEGAALRPLYFSIKKEVSDFKLDEHFQMHDSDLSCTLRIGPLSEKVYRHTSNYYIENIDPSSQNTIWVNWSNFEIKEASWNGQLLDDATHLPFRYGG